METRNMVRGICFDTVHGKDFYLLLKAAKGYWENPGGGIDPGEGKLGALIREIGEETGLDARRIYCIGNDFVEYDNLRNGEMIHSKVSSYAVRVEYSLDIKLSEEDGHTNFCWASYDDAIFMLNAYPQQAPIFKRVVGSYKDLISRS